MKGMRLSDY